MRGAQHGYRDHGVHLAEWSTAEEGVKQVSRTVLTAFFGPPRAEVGGHWVGAGFLSEGQPDMRKGAQTRMLSKLKGTRRDDG